MPDTSHDGAIQLAETIRSNVEKMGIPHEYVLHLEMVTISLGVATSEVTLNGTSDVSYEELVKQADMALYKSKEQGRNRVTLFFNVV